MPHKSLEKIKKTAQYGVSILNGIVGDKLQHTGLGIEMGFFHLGKRIIVEQDRLLEHFAQSNKVPTNKVCILVHGVTDNEATWLFRDQSDYGSLLAQDMQYTPFYLRYNSGLHISDNGAILAALLEKLYQNYPVAITEICIIAHSMGGLVTHSACYHASEEGLIWPQKVKQIFLLATPHLGSYLEKFANLTTNILEKVPNWHTRLVGKVINLRSAGIKDLRYGYLTESDWKDQDPDRLLKNNKKPPPVLENTAYYVISGRLTDTERHWVSQLFGDILVSTKSAVARSKNTEEFNFSDDNHFAMAKTFHFQLQSSIKVYEQIKNWLQ